MHVPWGGKDQFITRYISAKMSCQNKHTCARTRAHTHTHTNTVNVKLKKKTKLGVLVGCRHCLKHLSVSRITKPKNIFWKISKAYVPPPPENPVVLTGEGAGEEKRIAAPFFLPEWAEPSYHRHWHVCDYQTEDQVPVLMVSLEARFEFWLISSSLSYQSLPTSTTMAEWATVFLSKL